MRKQKLSVLLADDHKIVRDGLRLLIDSQPDMRVVGEAADGQEVVCQARELKPDVVVMDLSMPRVSGLEATGNLKSEFPDLKIVVLTAHDDESYLTQLCRAGAAGFVSKRSAGDELVRAIGIIATGGLYFEPALASKALARRIVGPPADRSATGVALSEREREVLVRIAWGFANKEIAVELKLSVKTVETYKVRLSEKLGFRSRAEIVQYALKKGWLDHENPPGCG